MKALRLVWGVQLQTKSTIFEANGKSSLKAHGRRKSDGAIAKQ